MEVDIDIVSLSGLIATLPQVAAAETVFRLKGIIAKTCSVPSVEQRLLVGCHELWDSHDVQHIVSMTTEGKPIVTMLRRPEEEVRWLRLVSMDGQAVHHLPEELVSNRSFLMALLQHLRSNTIVVGSAWDEAVAHVVQTHPNDRELVRLAVASSPAALQYASDEVRNDPAIVSVAIEEEPLVMRYASEELKKDADFIAKAVREHPVCLKLAHPEIRGCRTFVAEVAQQQPLCLRFAVEELRMDEDFVMAAAQQNAECLAYAADSLRKDNEFIKKAVLAIKDAKALQHVPVWIRGDADFMLRLLEVTCDASCLEYASAALRKDRPLFLQAARINPGCLRYMDESLLNDDSFLREVLNKRKCEDATGSEEEPPAGRQRQREPSASKMQARESATA